MDQPTDRTVESIRAAHLQTVAATRGIAAQALAAVAWALYAAAGSVVVLMFLEYVASGMRTGFADWPGAHWYAVAPLAVAAVTLQVGAARVGQSGTQHRP
jgi:hypothetical protein